MINWPTAFVIAVAIVAGAFLYQKPGAAQFGGGDGVALVGDAYVFIHAVGEKVRLCNLKDDYRNIHCESWH